MRATFHLDSSLAAIKPANPVALPGGTFNLTCTLTPDLVSSGYNSSSIAFVVGKLRADATTGGRVTSSDDEIAGVDRYAVPAGQQLSFGVEDALTARLVIRNVSRALFNNAHLHCYAEDHSRSPPGVRQVGQLVLNVNG